MDSLTWHVMDALADDWESIAQIRPHVHQYCGPVSDEEIFHILRQLREDDLVEIMKSRASLKMSLRRSEKRVGLA